MTHRLDTQANDDKGTELRTTKNKLDALRTKILGFIALGAFLSFIGFPNWDGPPRWGCLFVAGSLLCLFLYLERNWKM